MTIYMSNKIKDAKDHNGLTAAQAIYRGLFISTKIYTRYKADVDTILVTDGYGDCIVTV